MPIIAVNSQRSIAAHPAAITPTATFALSARVAHSGWLMRIVGNVGCIIKTVENDHYDAESHLCLKSKKVKE